MKTKIFALLFIFNGILNAQTPIWQWANRAGKNSGEAGYSISNDVFGNSYALGIFKSPSITFGSYNLTNTNNNNATGDIFLVKYSSSGAVVWAKKAGGYEDDYGYSISTDANGNSYITLE